MRDSGIILTDSKQNIITIKNQGSGASIDIIDNYGNDFLGGLVFDSVESLDVFYKSCRKYIMEPIEVEKMLTEE